MLKVMFCLRRRTGMTRDQFQEHWRGRHAEIALSRLDRIGAVRYIQNHTLTGEINDSLQESRGAPEPFDGIAELWFSSIADVEGTFTRAEARRAMRALLVDEPEFIDIEESPIFVVEEHSLWIGQP